MTKEEKPPKHGVYASGRSRPAPRKRTGHYYKWARQFAGVLKRRKKTGPQVVVEKSPSMRRALRRNRVGVAPKIGRACNAKKVEAAIHTRINYTGEFNRKGEPIVEYHYEPIKSMLHG